MGFASSLSQVIKSLEHVKFGDEDLIQNLPSAPGVSHGSIVQATSWIGTIASMKGGLSSTCLLSESPHICPLQSAQILMSPPAFPPDVYISPRSSPKAVKHSLIPCVTVKQYPCRLSLMQATLPIIQKFTTNGGISSSTSHRTIPERAVLWQ